MPPYSTSSNGASGAATPTANLAAYDAFLKAEAASQAMAAGDPPSLRRAIGFYQQAVTLDSAFVPAWGQLARAQANLYGNSTPTPELAAQAQGGRIRRLPGQHAVHQAHGFGPVTQGVVANSGHSSEARRSACAAGNFSSRMGPPARILPATFDRRAG